VSVTLLVKFSLAVDIIRYTHASLLSLTFILSCRGYMPPEFIHRGTISNKFDIFSLGVIIIKIMAGPTGREQMHEMSSQPFLDLV
jgi:serine/threonine protein kinase